MVVSLLIWSLLPAVIGWTPRVILSGSMEPRIHVGDIIVTREVPDRDPGQGPGPHGQGPRPPRQDPHAPHGAPRRRRLDRHAGRRQPPGRLLARLRRRGPRPRRRPGPVRRPPDVLGGRAQLARPRRHRRSARLVPLRRVPGQRRSARTTRDSDDQDRPAPAPVVALAASRRVAATVAVAAVAAGALAGPAEAAFRKRSGTTRASLPRRTFYPYKTAVLADSPSLYWRLDETSGTAIADAGTGNRARDAARADRHAGRRPAPSRPRRPTRAIALTIGLDHRQRPVAGPATFSVEAWVKTTSTTGGRILGLRQRHRPERLDHGRPSALPGPQRQGALRHRHRQDDAGQHGSDQQRRLAPRRRHLHPGNNGMKLYVDGTLQGQTPGDHRRERPATGAPAPRR